MNKIYQNNNNNSHRSNVAQGSAGAGANTTRVGPQSAVTTAAQPTNVPNNNHGHQQQQQHHRAQHGHNPHHHPQQQHHQQHQQQQHSHHQQPQQQHPQHPQQQHQHQHLHHPHHLQSQNPAYAPHPTGHIAHDVIDHHLHQPPLVATPQQVQQGPGGAPPPPPVQSTQQQQNNSMIKQHPRPQQTSMANSQMHPPQHHHNHHHHNQQHHNPMHLQQQPQMQISPSIPQQQWIETHPPQTQSSQAQHHQQPSQHQHQHQHQHHQQSPQQQPPHHITHPPPHPIMFNQQYPSQSFIYPMGPHFVPSTGHVPQYDHSSVASHQADPVNINSQQQPVSINNHHSGNMPITQIPAQTLISTATTGTTNVHQINNGQMMEAHMPNRVPHPFMIQGAYLPNHPYLLSSYMSPYTGGQIPPLSPAMLPPGRVTTDLGIRQQFDPQTNPLPVATPSLSQPFGVKASPVTAHPPTNTGITSLPTMPIKPREKKLLEIIDPLTRHVFTIDELKSSSSTPQSQSSKDSSAPRISSKDPSSANKESFSEDVVVNACGQTSNDMPTEQSSPIHKISSLEPKSESEEEQAQSITEDNEMENGEIESKVDIELADEISTINISVVDVEPDDESENMKETPVEQTIPNLPYAAGQFSPLNPNGSKKYSIEFLRAVAKEMNIELDATQNQNRIDFSPHYVNQSSGSSNFRGDYTPSQPLMRRSSQQVISKPRRVITTHSLQQEVELKTADKPWKPELETDKTKIVEDGEMDTKRLLKVFRGHLNKLTPQKYDSLIEKIGALDLDGAERLSSVIDLVFDKAVDEPGFCELYARMCKVIATKDSDFCFHLVKKCQDEFETSDLYDGLNIEVRKLKIEQEIDIPKKKMMSEELYEDMRLRRKKYLGTIKLIGEMYKLGLLLPKIIGFCMNHLIEEASNENIECLCSLIATVGMKMANEHEIAIKSSLKNTLSVLQDLAYSKKTEFLESRIKFKILDTIDLSKRNWKPRMVENNPKKIEEIRKEAKVELMRQQHHNHSSQSKNLLKQDDRDRAPRPGPNLYTFSKGKW